MAPTVPRNRLRGTLGNRSHALGCLKAAGSRGNNIPPTWLLAHTETCPGVTLQRRGKSLSQCCLTPVTVLPREHLLGLSHSQGGRRRLGARKHTLRQTSQPPKPGRPQQVWGCRANLQ